MSNNTYWSGNGKHQVWYDMNQTLLVPDEGPAPTLEGEMLRAASTLYYDYYNNGMCNNTSGAANFLTHCNIEHNLGITDELFDISIEANTDTYAITELARQLEKVIDEVIEFIQSKVGQYSETADTLDNYQDNDWSFDDFEEYIASEWYDDEDDM